MEDTPPQAKTPSEILLDACMKAFTDCYEPAKEGLSELYPMERGQLLEAFGQILPEGEEEFNYLTISNALIEQGFKLEMIGDSFFWMTSKRNP